MFLVDKTLLCNLVKRINKWVAVIKGKVWKKSWTAQQSDFYFMPFGSLMFWVSPVLTTYRKPRLLGFWYISWFLLRVNSSCSGYVYPQYITCLLSSAVITASGDCSVLLLQSTPGTNPEPSNSFTLDSCMPPCFSSPVAAFGQAESADWCTPRVFCTWGSFLSCRGIYFVMETPLYLSCFFDKTGWIWKSW